MAKGTVEKVLILGAAGRDFHNFNMAYRDNPGVCVVAFTAAQIPRIDGRLYPAELAGRLYPDGIPIWPEDQMEEIIRKYAVDRVVFAYSDVSHDYVMHLASRAGAVGADFCLLGGASTEIVADRPVISVCAARTGCGKSQTSRKLATLLGEAGVAVAVVRHPMPYGDLLKQRVQCFATYEDLRRHDCTIEEIEEYEQYVERGMSIYAGVDYEEIVRQASANADVIVWDGGNNDTPFVRSDLRFTVVDPLRPGHELKYYPGEVNLRAADVIIVNKVGSASPENVESVVANLKAANPGARRVLANSVVSVDDPGKVQGSRVLVVEDGPTLTHGGMAYGAGSVAARQFGAKEIVDPRPFAAGPIAAAFEKYPHMGPILPALGYYQEQLDALAQTIDRCDCDVVIIGTPVDLRRYLKLNKPAVRVTYDLVEREGEIPLKEILDEFLAAHGLA